MRLSKALLVLLCTLPFALFAQTYISNNNDITGLWTGTLFNDTTGQYSKYELAISRDKGKYIGFSHTWFNINGKQYYGVKKVGVKKAPDGKIIIVDEDLLTNNYPELPGKYMRQLNVLSFEASDTAALLSGPFVTNRTKEYQVLTGFVNLKKANGAWPSALWPHLQDLGKEKDFTYMNAAAPVVASNASSTNNTRSTEEKK